MDNENILERCFSLAKQSPCQKRGFGCILVKDGKIIAEAFNGPIDNISQLCAGRCIRLDMPSGSDSMIGDCGHAEERVVWQCINKGISVIGARLYVLGINRLDNTIIQNLKFYCVRCSTMMRYAQIAGVYIYHDSGWHFVTTAEAYNTSLEFAIKK